MKIKTGELTGNALDWAVMVALLPVLAESTPEEVLVMGGSPSTNRHKGGLIIEQEGIHK